MIKKLDSDLKEQREKMKFITQDLMNISSKVEKFKQGRRAKRRPYQSISKLNSLFSSTNSPSSSVVNKMVSGAGRSKTGQNRMNQSMIEQTAANYTSPDTNILNRTVIENRENSRDSKYKKSSKRIPSANILRNSLSGGYRDIVPRSSQAEIILAKTKAKNALRLNQSFARSSRGERATSQKSGSKEGQAIDKDRSINVVDNHVMNNTSIMSSNIIPREMNYYSTTRPSSRRTKKKTLSKVTSFKTLQPMIKRSQNQFKSTVFPKWDTPSAKKLQKEREKEKPEKFINEGEKRDLKPKQSILKNSMISMKSSYRTDYRADSETRNLEVEKLKIVIKSLKLENSDYRQLLEAKKAEADRYKHLYNETVEQLEKTREGRSEAHFLKRENEDLRLQIRNLKETLDSMSQKVVQSRSQNTELELMLHNKDYKIGYLEREMERAGLPLPDYQADLLPVTPETGSVYDNGREVLQGKHYKDSGLTTHDDSQSDNNAGGSSSAMKKSFKTCPERRGFNQKKRIRVFDTTVKTWNR